jgi:hypothetical protein
MFPSLNGRGCAVQTIDLCLEVLMRLIVKYFSTDDNALLTIYVIGGVRAYAERF